MLRQASHNDLESMTHMTTSDNLRSKSINKAPKRRSSALRFFASNSPPKQEAIPQTQKEWEAQYLKSLRTDRPARPSGSRPPPPQKMVAAEPYVRAASALSMGPTLISQEDIPKPTLQERAASALSHRRAQSDMPKLTQGGSLSGRALARPPEIRQSIGDFTRIAGSPKAPTDSAPMPYHEDGLRWVEKQEAKALREAMEEMDVREEAKVHANAQDEASQLVWQHMNGHSARESQIGRRNYREHLREGSHARSLSKAWGRRETSLEKPGSSHSAQTSEPTTKDATKISPSTGGIYTKSAFDGQIDATRPRNHVKWDSPEKKAYTSLAFQGSAIEKGRRRSSGIKKRTSSGGPFRNPDDQIYEDAKSPAPIELLSEHQHDRKAILLASQNPDLATNVNAAGRQFMPSTKIPTLKSSSLYKSRGPHVSAYTESHRRNQVSMSFEPPSEDKQQLEVRSDDIRAATSKRLKDRSPKLPTPAFISGNPGQHIVSFDKDWRPREQKEFLKGMAGQRGSDDARPTGPNATTSMPVVPTISVSTDAPSIDVTEVAVTETPSISVSEDPSNVHRPSSSASAKKFTPANRPLPHHSASTPVRQSNIHWSPASHRTTAQCATCALPIAGRIVSAASQRFHPGCFNCYNCQTALECVAFYPEPENKRSERLSRIQSRLNGNDELEDKPGESAEDDGDESLRFYCHLDFHELFSPRCRSCKTPIESEVVVACGGTWHVGHFFCAECGDPFDPKTPFVEKDGYAWCVKCHAGRFNGKCKGCKKTIIEAGISALGAEWHESCFVCVECRGGFDDGRFFTRGEDQQPVCVACEERRLKA